MDFDSPTTAGELAKFFGALHPETPVEFDAGYNNIDCKIRFTGNEFVDHQLSRLACEPEDLSESRITLEDVAPMLRPELLKDMPDWVDARIEDDEVVIRRQSAVIHMQVRYGGCQQ